MDKFQVKKLVQKVDEHIPIAESLFRRLSRETTDPLGGITRASYGEGENFARKLVSELPYSHGMEITEDYARHTDITIPGSNRSAPALYTGSHLDSQPKAGNYDGAAGVISGLIALIGIKSAGIIPEQDTTLMACRGEECGHIGS